MGDSIGLDDQYLKHEQKKQIKSEMDNANPKNIHKELVRLRQEQRGENQRWKGVLFIILYGIVLSVSYLIAKFLF